MSLAIGIVVDDAIMVLENIVRHFHMGKTARQAALDGAREITFAATAATISVIAVFIPVLLVGGFIGVFLFQFGMTISTAVGLSLLEAITLTPMRCSQFMTAKEDEYRFAVFVNRIFSSFARFYGRALALSLKHRWKVVSGALGLFALSLLSIQFLTKEFMPTQDIGVFIIRFQTPIGSSLTFTSNKAAEMETILARNPNISHYFVNTGGFEGGETNKGMSFISLKDQGERKDNQEKIMDSVRDDIKKEIPKDFEAFMINPSGNFGGAKRGTSLELSVRGPDYAVLKEKVAEMTKRFTASGLMTDVDTDFRDGVTEVHVEPDREKAAASGVSVQDIADTINTAIGGVRQGYFTNGIRRYDVRIRPASRAMEHHCGHRQAAHSHRIRGVDSAFLCDQGHRGEKAAHHHARNARTGDQYLCQHGHRQIARQGDGVRAEDSEGRASRRLHAGGDRRFKDVIEAFESFIFTLVMGLVISYMVLAVQFNSFIHPIPVMIALPLFAYRRVPLALAHAQLAQSLQLHRHHRADGHHAEEFDPAGGIL